MDKEGKHTPGPWTFNRDTVNKTLRIIPVADGYGAVGAAFTEPNAALIATAPGLLAWLERHYEREEGPGETDRPEYAELRVLLAKASAA